QIAVIVARGQIVNGSQKAGMIGGDSTAKLIRDARNNEQTKAIVLRIDSPGGSAFASEIIRQEILQAKEAGIPVIASMSSVAASGGYWIAADADKIVAAPTTITGSIGVFGLLMTLEDSFA
ncbi:MAG TPA: signal peptide peptidase SppA, partial [Idiomarina abyssalis]